MSKEDYIKNIGKRCKIIESVIAGLTGQEGLIVAVFSDDKGDRYEVHTDNYLPVLNHNIFFPPTFNCEVYE